jgi:DNA invertase Pin-like site-specific DNA recombinase
MKIGYARVSTDEQELALQLDALEKAGCEKVYSEHASSMKVRPKLDAALADCREGDVLVVYRLDRVGRSVKGLITLVEDLQARGVGFLSTSDAIDTSTPMGRFFFHIMASLAQMERELLIDRTQAGLKAARKRGRKGGRPPALTPAKVDAAKTLLASGSSRPEVARALGVSKATIYRYLPPDGGLPAR